MRGRPPRAPLRRPRRADELLTRTRWRRDLTAPRARGGQAECQAGHHIPNRPRRPRQADSSLDALSLAVAPLRAHVLARLADPIMPRDDARPRRARVAADLAQLAGALDRAASACAEARHSIRPVAGELAGA